MMAVAFFIDYLNQNINELYLPKEVVVLVGLILGEISKQIYNIYSNKQ